MAKIIHPSIFLVIKRFPNRSERIRHLYNEDECFQSLCESYRLCTKALSYWAQSDHQIAMERHREYSALLADLEKEIQQYQDDKSTDSLL